MSDILRKAPEGDHPATPLLARAGRRRFKSYETSIVSGRGVMYGWRVATLVVVCLALAANYSGDSLGYGSYAFALSVTYGIAVLGGNLVTGFLEEVNLAQGGLMAIGAYSAAYAEVRGVPMLLSLVIGTAVTTVVGAALASAVIRLNGVYTALLTFSLSYAVPDLANYFSRFTGGGSGTSVPFDITLFGATIGGSSPATVWLVTVVFLLCGLAFLTVGHLSPGRLMLVSKKRAFAAPVFGVHPQRVKWWTWVASCALCGLGGTLYALVVGFIVPGQFTLTVSLYLLVGTLAGGSRTAVGALIGGGLVGALPIIMSTSTGGSESIVLGALLLVVVVIGGSGIWSRVEYVGLWLVRAASSMWGARRGTRAKESRAKESVG